MDPEIEELKQLVQRNLALTEDTHRMVRRMRQAVAWGHFFKVLEWVIIIVLCVLAYTYYIRPYFEHLSQAYQNVQTQTQQVQNAGNEFLNFIKNHFTPPQQSSSPQVGS